MIDKTKDIRDSSKLKKLYAFSEFYSGINLNYLPNSSFLPDRKKINSKWTDNSTDASNVFVAYESVVDNYNNMLINPSLKAAFESYLNTYKIKYESTLATIESDFLEYSRPIVWEKHKGDNYYVSQLHNGFKFELFVESLFFDNGIELIPYGDQNGQITGENNLGIEIKYDAMAKKTDNYYIEIFEKNKPWDKNWVRSGILKNHTSEYLLIGNEYPYSWAFVTMQRLNNLLCNYLDSLYKSVGREFEYSDINSPLFPEIIEQLIKESTSNYRFKNIKTSIGFIIKQNDLKNISLNGEIPHKWSFIVDQIYQKRSF